MEDAEITAEKEHKVPGVPFTKNDPRINYAGRPPGSISIITKIKQKFEEDPEYFDEWINKLLEDPTNRKAVMEQIDGKARQPIDANVTGSITVNIVKYGDTQTDDQN